METSVVKRFLRYIAVDTQSAAEKDVIPSTAKQFDLAKILVEELKEMGAQDVKMDDHAYVYATVPATSEKEIPVLGLIAHMDTSPACSGKNVNPQFINNYDGKDILMNKETGLTMKVEDYPELLNYKGQDLITTDGTWLWQIICYPTRRSHTARSASDLPRTRKLAAAQISLMWPALALMWLIPLMAVLWENWNTRILTQHLRR